MPRRRKRERKILQREAARSFGSGLNEIGWHPVAEPIRLKPRVEKAIEQVQAEYEKALHFLATEGRFGGLNCLSTEQEATALVKESMVRRAKKRD